jgi:hypothetical protein
MIAAGVLVVVAQPLLFACQSFQHADEQDRLRETGVSAPPTILDVWDTNETINNSPVVGMRLDVRPESGPPFQVEIKQMVSGLRVSLFQPCRQATVRYDPNDWNKLVVDSVR